MRSERAGREGREALAVVPASPGAQRMLPTRLPGPVAARRTPVS
jgi:hypothetical protein